MIDVIAIAIWSHLFCGPWSEPEKVFGWLKSALYKRIPKWVFQPVIGCAMCHAVWVSLAWEGRSAAMAGEVTAWNFLAVFCSSFFAELLDDFKEWRERKINS